MKDQIAGCQELELNKLSEGNIQEVIRKEMRKTNLSEVKSFTDEFPWLMTGFLLDSQEILPWRHTLKLL